jgi:hypothetical protein
MAYRAMKINPNAQWDQGYAPNSTGHSSFAEQLLESNQR